MRRAVLGALVAVLLGAAPAHATPVTIDFESGATANQPVTNQYGLPGTPAGPVFKKGTDVFSSGAGSQPNQSGLTCTPPYLDNSDPAYSGTKTISLIGCSSGGEFTYTGAFFQLGYQTHSVDFQVGIAGGTPSSCPNFICAEIWTTGLNATGDVVAQQQTLLGPNTAFKEVPLQTSGDDIAFVVIERGSKIGDSKTGVIMTGLSPGAGYLVVDDLTYDPPSSPPASSFLIGSNPTSTSVAAGSNVTVKIPITWVNNPNPAASPVSLEVNAPVGVTPVLSDNPVSDGSSDLTLNVSKTAFAGDTSVIVTGYVDKGQPSEKHASVTIPLTITVPFFVVTPGDWTVAPCTAQEIPLRVATVGNFSDPITIDVSTGGQPGVTIAGISGGGQVLSPDHAVTTVNQQSGEADAALTLNVPPGTPPAAPVAWHLRAQAPGYNDQVRTGTLGIEAGHVTKVEANGTTIVPAFLQTPSLGAAGTDVKLTGTGFCPGSQVAVGDANNRATPSIDPGGRTLTFRVPRGASTGPIHLLPPAGTPFDGPGITVRSFRNTFGFSWVNKDWGGRLNGDMVDELFGTSETNVNILGVWVRKPEASLFEALANKHIPGGICFGMAYAGVEMRTFPNELQAFPNSGGSPYYPGTDPWHLNGPSAPSKELLGYVLGRFSLQFTDQLIPVELGAVLGIHQPDDDINLIKAELAKGDPVPVGMIKWNGLGVAGHTVLAYDTHPIGNDSIAVDVANSNVPYMTSEEGDANAHGAAEFTNSQIIIEHGHWSFAQLGWEGSEADLVIYKHDDLPIINGKPPKLPNVFVAGPMVVFGSAGDGVTQLTGSGGSLFSGGQLAAQTSWPRGVAPLPDFTGQPGPLQIVGANEKAGPLNATVRRGAGGGDMTVRLPGIQGNLHAGTHAGQIDHVGVDPHSGAIDYRTGAASAAFGGTLLGAPGALAAASASTRSDRLVQFSTTTTSTGGERLSFPGAREFVLHHAGPPATLSLTLGAFARDGHPIAVRVPALRLARGETLRVAPADWHTLKRIRVRAGAATRFVRGHALGRRFAVLKHAKLATKVVDLALRLRHLPAHAWLSVGAQVIGGPRATPLRLTGRALKRGRVHLTFAKRLAAGRQRLRVTLVEGIGDGPVAGSVVVRRTISVTRRGRP